ncbi:hypothetical protein L917_00180 [Phytophthora nicotianae]|uniref:Uncharacterized protein n=2 Tax=Phytophthora nicotianae TaxID=4792 RepID=W2M1V4_PHYNI|nr:hypothetical protein L917_00180 [Phytophthora nicotianae]ETO86246.1 hypothetical protein F444_00218 [Phytophthora nicotianae P1976]
MLLPMELSTCREPDAQNQYEPFRQTLFTHRRDDLASARGPGALFREEWNTMAGNAKRHRSRLLYRMERDVNPTPTATVQRFYDPQESTNVGSQLKKKGNAVVSLKSNVPRFLSTHDNGASSRGPGSYFPDRYNGAFPALFDKMTPHSVRLEKRQAKRALATTFGIIPAPAATISTSPDRLIRLRASKGTEDPTGQRAFADYDISLETTSLAPALTPRNTYQNPANRRFILATSPSDVSAGSTTS